MKHIKPGRAPSMINGIVGIFMVCFGILWTIIAAQAGGVIFVFGIIWTCIALIITVYNFRNATRKNRYSSFDITDSDEEPDPLNERFGVGSGSETFESEQGDSFCPYCGSPTEGDYKFCRKCGKKLP